MNAINPLSTGTQPSVGTRVVGGASQPNPTAGAAGGGESFKDLLVDSIKHVNGMQQQADQAVEALFTGGDVNPAEVLTAVQKADMAFRLTMQVRNKLMDVYHEIQEVRI